MRLCDEAGIDLEKETCKQVAVSKQDLKDLRMKWKEKKEASDIDLTLEHDKDGYKAFASKNDWKPENDMHVDNGAKEKMWYRWDWALEVNLLHVS